MRNYLSPAVLLALWLGTMPSSFGQKVQAPPSQAQPVQTTFTSAKGFVLEDETPVRLRLNRTISSADAHEGDTVDFEVLDDITVNGTLVIPKGGLAFATVTEAQGKRRMARGGKLDINIDYVKLVSGEKAALRAVKDVKGGGHTGGMVGGMVATSLIFFPAAPFFLFMHGKDVTIPKGTEITAYVNGDVRLDITKFQPSAPVNVSAQEARVPPIEGSGLQSGKVQLESTPPDADIEIDGSFVGNTPSELQLSDGEHSILVKRTGFKNWERKLRVHAGSNVHLNAELETMTASDTTLAPKEATKPDAATPPSSSQVISSSVVVGTTPDEPAPETFASTLIGASFDGNPDARHDGVTLTTLTPNGPAAQAGLQAGDVILAINDHYLFTIRELQDEISHHGPGSKIAVRYRRYSTINEATVVVGRVE